MYLDRLESLLKQNNGGDGWFVGSDVSHFFSVVQHGIDDLSFDIDHLILSIFS